MTRDRIQEYLPGRLAEKSGNVFIVPLESHELAAVFGMLKARSLPFVTMFATDERAKRGVFRVYYVFGLPAHAGAPEEPRFIVLAIAAKSGFPSLANTYPATALYEREIQAFFGLTPEGHPDPRSLILHEENWPRGMYPLRKDFHSNTRVPETESGSYNFKVVEGEGIYEIPVGPVHAGIIEPGHFRFSVAGEEIVSLESRLGWVHKGTEKLFETLSLDRKVSLAEHVSGDSAFSHSLAFCQALENLTGTEVPARAEYLRLIFAEMERLTMHLFDIGNIVGNGTGFSVLGQSGFRMSEMIRQMNEKLTGHRFLRGLNTPGGVTKDIWPEQSVELLHYLSSLQRDFSELVTIADGSASLVNRLKGTGIISREVADDYGALGLGARAAGIAKDARLDYPYAAYAHIVPEIALESAGDVEARFRVRIKEVHISIDLIERALASIPSGPLASQRKALPNDGMAIGVAESWRGEIAYVVLADSGAISRVKVRDPSFINWQLLSHLSSQDMVPDFPLINKSFNLSYSGNDL